MRRASTWLDVEAPSAEGVAEVYGRFGIPAHMPIDEPRMSRPSLLEEDAFALVTLVGAGLGDDLAQVRCFVGPDWLLTMHARALPRPRRALLGAGTTPPTPSTCWRRRWSPAWWPTPGTSTLASRRWRRAS